MPSSTGSSTSAGNSSSIWAWSTKNRGAPLSITAPAGVWAVSVKSDHRAWVTSETPAFVTYPMRAGPSRRTATPAWSAPSSVRASAETVATTSPTVRESTSPSDRPSSSVAR